MIDLDQHATTPLCDEARDAMTAWLGRSHGNASSTHTAGRTTRAALDLAREQVASACGARARSLVFTSGGTEALHLAVRGLAPGGVVWLDPGAHPALEAACLARSPGGIRWMPRGEGGAWSVGAIEKALAHERAPFVAVSLVQHETGVVAPLAAIVETVRARGGRVVVDAVQALGKIPLDLASSGVASAAVSSHKIGGPPGAGAAWFAPDERGVAAVTTGGAQERGLRAGTENTPGLVGFGAAAATVPARLGAMARVARLRDRLEAALVSIPDLFAHGNGEARVATACHVAARGIAGDELVAALDLAGVLASAGPACSSGRPGPSVTMLRLYPGEPWRARSALRLTLGPSTTDEDIDRAIDIVGRTIGRMRALGHPSSGITSRA